MGYICILNQIHFPGALLQIMLMWACWMGLSCDSNAPQVTLDDAELFPLWCQSGRNIDTLGINSTINTYSIILLLSHRCLDNFQCKPNLWYKWLFSQSNTFSIEWRVLLLRQTTGQREQPRVQQQHIQPHRSHFTFTGSAFFRVLLMRNIVSLNSSGATFPVSEVGNSTSNLLLRPNIVTFPAPLIMIGSGTATI